MLNKSFKKNTRQLESNPTFDQGWQYQKISNQLKEKVLYKVCPGNCLDNAIIENFFGILKSELFYLKNTHQLTN
jgi:putative transposase